MEHQYPYSPQQPSNPARQENSSTNQNETIPPSPEQQPQAPYPYPAQNNFSNPNVEAGFPQRPASSPAAFPPGAHVPPPPYFPNGQGYPGQPAAGASHNPPPSGPSFGPPNAFGASNVSHPGYQNGYGGNNRPMSNVPGPPPYAPIPGPVPPSPYGTTGMQAGPLAWQAQVMPDGTPIRPTVEERSWIKRFYNWTGGILLIRSGAVYFFYYLVVIAYALFTLPSWNVANILTALSGNISQDAAAVANAVAMPVANLTMLFIGCKVTKISFRDFFAGKNYGPGMVIGGTSLALGWQTISVFVVSFIMGILGNAGVQPDVSDLAPISTFATVAYSLFYSCIGAPVTEELLFRGFCLKNLSRVNLRFGIIASSLLFALMHGNFYQFPLALVIGIILAQMTVKSGNIWPAIVTHIIVNSVSTIFSNLYVWNYEAGVLLDYAWTGLSIVGALVALIVCIVRKQLALPPADIAKKNRGWNLFFTSPTLLIFFIVSVISCLASFFV